MIKIGILGGTFDPPHLGHLRLAEAALKQLELDEVLFVPANRNPLKEGKKITSAKHRLQMVECLASGNAQFTWSDLEMSRGGSSFAVDTLAELQFVRPGEYWFLMGADSLKTFPEWKQPNRILKMCRLGVSVRPPLSESMLRERLPQEILDRTDFINMDPIDLSSTDLRFRLENGKNVGEAIPPVVMDYIRSNKLYRL